METLWTGNIKIDWKYENKIGNNKSTLKTSLCHWKQKTQIGNIKSRLETKKGHRKQSFEIGNIGSYHMTHR